MILDHIVEQKQTRLKEQKKHISEAAMRRLAEESQTIQRGFANALKKPGISVIGEFKKASPSLGKIKSQISLSDRIAEYNNSVDAISCLTEEDYFNGSVGDFCQIRERSPLPMLRKDFLIDEYQIYEAKAIGADAVLLIAAISDDARLHDFYQLTKELKLDALVEVHDEKETERVLKQDIKIIGVNNRNLKDFSIRLLTTKQLSSMIPDDKIFVSESGIVTDEDVLLLKECGVDAFLIGRALMESKRPCEVVKRWKSI